ncbi:MAG: hypothetical protein PUP92_36915 [Rhizonema sp. PD38]|nr:hypothetical protein [Rhizonema sp. PD38]
MPLVLPGIVCQHPFNPTTLVAPLGYRVGSYWHDVAAPHDGSVQFTADH